MNLNELAREVTLREGLKKSISIAQVKEVIRCLGDVLCELSPETALAVVALICRRRVK